MMADRVILHCDLNSFYASVNLLFHPELAHLPVGIAGDPDKRHGIILAKNDHAKKFGVKTGHAIWEARQRCQSLVVLPPMYEAYKLYSQYVRDYYLSYTSQVEPFGLDEAWLDVTGSTHLFGSGAEIANRLRRDIYEDLGLTISAGVSYNKIFAKLGSDYKKPNATTIITRDKYQEVVWPLPVSDLLYVGRATDTKLERYSIRTIGQLAALNPDFLKRLFGVNGLMLWSFANGFDDSPVAEFDEKADVKSIGNSTTAPRDLVTDDDVKITLLALAESVATRLREHGYRCRTVHLSIRDLELASVVRQTGLADPTNLAKEIYQAAWRLFQANRPTKPVRSIGVRACNLEEDRAPQLSFYPEHRQHEKDAAIERVLDHIRGKYGYYAIQRGLTMIDRALNLDAKSDNTIHPVGYLGTRRKP